MDAGKLNRRVTILQRTETQEQVYGTYELSWAELATVWAEVQDMLPSRSDRLADGVSISSRPCRVRMRYRTDISSDMRLTVEGRSGTWRIITQPAEIGNREGIEIVAEQLTTEGREP